MYKDRAMPGAILSWVASAATWSHGAVRYRLLPKVVSRSVVLLQLGSVVTFLTSVSTGS